MLHSKISQFLFCLISSNSMSSKQCTLFKTWFEWCEITFSQLANSGFFTFKRLAYFYCLPPLAEAVRQRALFSCCCWDNAFALLPLFRVKTVCFVRHLIRIDSEGSMIWKPFFLVSICLESSMRFRFSLQSDSVRIEFRYTH